MEKISSLIGEEFSSEPVSYGGNGEYVKTKIKSYKDNVNTNFHGKKHQRKILHVNICY